MDISKISDMNLLKSLAYDRIAIIENAQSELRVIQERIRQVDAEEAEKAATKQDKK